MNELTAQDYLTYWAHRIYHMPFLYKHFHKLHHTYKHPTAFSVTAIHPVEFVSIQCIYISPMLLFPVHFGKPIRLSVGNHRFGIEIPA
jgi:lathosterol oxidase